jgi:hypothetical protein
MITKDARCTGEIKSRVLMVNAAFNKKKNLFTNKLELKISNKLVKGYISSIHFYGAVNSTLQDIVGK